MIYSGQLTRWFIVGEVYNMGGINYGWNIVRRVYNRVDNSRGGQFRRGLLWWHRLLHLTEQMRF